MLQDLYLSVAPYSVIPSVPAVGLWSTYIYIYIYIYWQMGHLLSDSLSSHNCQNMWLELIGLALGRGCRFVFCAFLPCIYLISSFIFSYFILVDHQREPVTSGISLTSSCFHYFCWDRLFSWNRLLYLVSHFYFYFLSFFTFILVDCETF